MASAALLDVDALVAPVPGKKPAGDPHAYTRGLREQFQELRREEKPEDFDDATRPAQLKKADWDGVVKLAQEALLNKSKDLRVACHLVEGLARREGFSGLLEGLRLLGELIDGGWERLNPPIEEGDLDSRAEPLANMLDDPARGIGFPTTVRSIPLVPPYGLSEWTRLRQGRDSDAQRAVAQALASTPPEQLRATAETIDHCLEALRRLVEILDERLQSAAPGLTNLGAALTDCRSLLEAELARLAPAEPAGQTAAPCGEGLVPSDDSAPSLSRSDRAEIYGQLERAAGALQRLEPHSPIPYFVMRAVRLGRMPYPELIENLIRDPGVLAELNREMGVQTEPGGAPAAG